MSKNKKTEQQKQRFYYRVHPWEVTHEKSQSTIKAYVEASGEFETVATVFATSGDSAESIANYIVKQVNSQDRNEHLLRAALTLLELFLAEGEGLDFSSEQEVEHTITNIKKVVGS